MASPQAWKFNLGDLNDPGVVAGPAADSLRKVFQCTPPFLVVNVEVVRADDQDVDVAAGVPVPPSRTAEKRGVDGRLFPVTEQLAQPVDELRAWTSDLVDGRRQ